MMPNWCSNTVEICATEVDGGIIQFAKDVRSENSEFDFNKILPRPVDLDGICTGGREIAGQHYNMWRDDADGNPVPITSDEQDRLIAQYGAANWYDWSIANWGTKWSPDSDVIVNIHDDDFIRYEFDTAWSPPSGIYRILVDRYPDLIISWLYNEPGAGFAGYLQSEDRHHVDLESTPPPQQRDTQQDSVRANRNYGRAILFDDTEEEED